MRYGVYLLLAAVASAADLPAATGSAVLTYSTLVGGSMTYQTGGGDPLTPPVTITIYFHDAFVAKYNPVGALLYMRAENLLGWQIYHPLTIAIK